MMKTPRQLCHQMVHVCGNVLSQREWFDVAYKKLNKEKRSFEMKEEDYKK